MGEALGSLGINGPFLLSQAVNFLILFGLLTVFLWKPAARRLDERRAMQAKQQEDAEAVARAREEIEQERAQILDAARAEASGILTDARAQARGVSEKATADARQETEKILAAARKEAGAERDRALGRMREQIAALAIAAAHQLIGESLDEKRQRSLVDAFFSGVRAGKVEVLPEKAERAEGPVTVTSAVPLDEAEQKTIRSDLAERLGAKEIAFQVDPQILGGLVIRVGDRLIDGSMAGQLGQLRQSLA